MSDYFRVSESNSTVQREVLGGLTTFATMSYIVFVQPTVLSIAGMPFGAVLLATCLSSAVACFLMAFLARYPFALAPGMGTNFLFAFTVCGSMGFSWQAGLTIVLIAGLLFLFLSLFGAREKAMAVLPDCLKNAIGPAIGLFIAFIGLQWGGVVIASSATMVTLGPLTSGPPLITLGCVLLIAGLMARGFRPAMLLGIIIAAGAGFVTGILEAPVEPLRITGETFFNLAYRELIERWQDAIIAIALLFFLDFFDTVGTMVGLSKQGGFLDERGHLPRAPRAFVADALGTCTGALMGTSTVTTYIESSTGIAAGARTGLATVVTGLCFIAALVFAPLVRIAGQDAGPAYYASIGMADLAVSMYPAVAPAMIVVGVLMLAPLQHVIWDDITEALPAFLTVAMMPFGYGITEGIAMGIVSYTLVKLLSGRGKEAHWVLYGIAVLLILRYAFLV